MRNDSTKRSVFAWIIATILVWQLHVAESKHVSTVITNNEPPKLHQNRVIKTSKVPPGLQGPNNIVVPKWCEGTGFYLSINNKNCYFFGETQNSDWTGAEDICKGKNAHLATPSTFEKNQDLITYIRWRHAPMYYENIWIGLHKPIDPDTSGAEVDKKLNWVWVDGSKYDLDVTQWSPGEPSEVEKWVRLRDGKWFATHNASDAEFFVCVKEPSPNHSSRPQATLYTRPADFQTSSENWSTLELTTASSDTDLSNTVTLTFDSDPASQVCDTGWHHIDSTNTCYLLEKSQGSTWSEIKVICEQVSGNLASPATSEEFGQFLKFLAIGSLSSSNVWIGLECKDDISATDMCQTWGWVDGSPYSMQWHLWNDGEPGQGEKLVRVRHGKWFATVNESDAEYFVCEKEGNFTTSLPLTPTKFPRLQNTSADLLPWIFGVTEKPDDARNNLSLLAILLVIVPVTFFGVIAFLLKRRRRGTQTVIQNLQPQEKKDNVLERTAKIIAEPALYHLSQNTKMSIDQLEEFSKQSDRATIIQQEFQSIPNHVDFIQTESNIYIREKNRFRDIKPYDANRVQLNKIPGVRNSDYINASFIDSYEYEKTFIATDGPANHTLIDFWRMIWEYNVKCIVMLTQLTERNKVICKQYWPSQCGNWKMHGNLQVQLIKEKKLADHICRWLKVNLGKDERNLLQFQTESWIDTNIPNSVLRILNLRKEIRKFVSADCPPIVVHCSDGVGRTGTLLGVDYLLQQAAKEGIVDVPKCVAKLRKQRVKMVLKAGQYDFLYRAVTMGALLGNTSIPVLQFISTYPEITRTKSCGASRIDYEFKVVKECTSNYSQRPPRRASNRGKWFHIHLNVRSDETTEHINTEDVFTSEQKFCFIATQAPLVGTAVDFWRVVWDQKCAIIVMLCPPGLEEVYYPEMEGDINAIPPFKIECSSVTTNELITIRELALSVRVKRPVLHVSIRSLFLSMSSEELLEIFLAICDAVKKRNIKYDSTDPVLVHCLDGVEWTGIYCIFSCLLDKLEHDQEIDVFEIVRCLKQQCNSFIASKEQYGTLYEMMYFHLGGRVKHDEDTPNEFDQSSNIYEETVDEVTSPVAATDTPSVMPSDVDYVNSETTCVNTDIGANAKRVHANAEGDNVNGETIYVNMDTADINENVYVNADVNNVNTETVYANAETITFSTEAVYVNDESDDVIADTLNVNAEAAYVNDGTVSCRETIHIIDENTGVSVETTDVKVDTTVKVHGHGVQK